MAQSVGYVLAATGPFALHSASGTWHLPLSVLLALTVPMATFGTLAGRARNAPV